MFVLDDMYYVVNSYESILTETCEACHGYVRFPGREVLRGGNDFRQRKGILVHTSIMSMGLAGEPEQGP